MTRDYKEPSLPKQQLAILALCRFAEPVTATSINPYLPEMIQSFNVPIDQVAQYSGWLSACFSLSQCLTAIVWGRASDRLGRKPMILFALALVMASTVMFGFSTSVTMAFVARSIQGLSSGNVGIVRTVVAEMVPQRELQPRAFSIMPLVWNVGSVFGPSIGGSLVRPVDRYPGLFKNSTLLKDYPFALPNLVISVLFLIGITSGIFFLRETHEDRKNQRDYGLVLGQLLIRPCVRRSSRRRASSSHSESRPFLDDDELNQRRTSMTANTVKAREKTDWSAVFSTQSNINLAAYTGLAMHSIAFDGILPVFLNYPPNSKLDSPVVPPFKFAGGFGLASPRIGLLFTIYGTWGMIIQFLVFPPMAKRFGVLKCFKACALFAPSVYFLVPFTSLIEDTTTKQAVLVLLMLLKGVIAIFAFPCSIILLTNSATSLKVLGTLNGVATSVSALGRALGPALAGAAFTIGVNAGYIILPFWVLTIVAVLSAVPVFWLKEKEEDSTKQADEEDSEAILDGDEDFDSETRAEIVGMGVDGTGDAQLMSDDMPFLSPTTSKSSQGRPRKGSYSLKHVSTSVDTSKAGVLTGARRYSNGINTSRSGTNAL